MDDIALQLLREYATRSLRNFVGVFWPVLENDRPVAWGWALDAMADHLEAVTRGEITRLVINVPPGSMKSLMVSVMWPAWEWAIGRPQTKIIGVAHNTALSGRDARKMRRLVQSQEYRDLFPHVELTKDQNSKLNFENTAYGQRVCMAFRNMTGERGDRVIIDDPMTVEDGFSKAAIDEAARIFNETVPSRVNDSKSAIVMIMQRIHESDPASIALSDPMYEKLIIPMRWDSKFPTETKRFRDPRDGGPDGVLFFPERFSADQVEALERRLGPYGTASQLQQQPAPRSGGYLDPSNIGVADRDTLPPNLRLCRGWDLAATEGGGDYTVGALVGLDDLTGKVYLLDVVRGQWGSARVDATIKRTAAMDGPLVEQSLPIDPGAAGKRAADQYAIALTGYAVHTSRETGDKMTRARPLSSIVQDGRFVVACDPDMARPVLDEFAAAPVGKHDDTIDAVSRALNRLTETNRYNLEGLI